MTEQRDADSLPGDSQQSETPGDRLESENLTPALPAENSWKNRIADVWRKATPRLGQLLPVEQLAQTVVQWFSVSETQIAEILETVRRELPTTEALLIGKPQAGKSSIVRGLTGVSADIVGQGFRPHTQHTQRYNYPADDLPLLVFTDTVGLGDVKQDTQEIITELVGDLEKSTRSARVLILTVKINDFATDTLRQIAQQLRQQYPDIPCLLAVTCLHEVYPPGTVDHPAYPPDYEEINRAFGAIQEDFAKVCDRSVLIDFTLEEDGYNPVFYGLEALRDNLAELLPEAEAKAIYQLLDREETGKQLGNLYRDTGRRYILPFAIMAATVAAIPLPFATMPVLTALQVSMVTALGNLYGKQLSPSQAGGIVSAIAGGFLAQAIARELIKFVPGFGSVIAASWAAAYTWSLGETACVYFGDLMGGKKPDPNQIQSVMQEAFKAAQERFKGIKR
ncbi:MULTISPECIES: GTPase family protein [Calothrix]|uniref:50S ribosome-binding GTPase n=2 Tax=Calothrix TaxID=1186 RepID=A0ABR8AAE3_9CYAN|nr:MULTISPECIES: 50S ribosome-binding GTPase [Calothrix]MBD2196016.1 50S ribosome-binding GTPase [Calothrix parietina FACHB-288]MBD2224494.1 50S ribosome-binding GTPase [Calothrix anomala FACHB-343]